MSGQARTPYWRLAGFYLCYFAALGAFVPYWGLYLESQGFTPLQIGDLMAMVAVTRILAPNLWSWIADVTGSGLSLIRWASFTAFLGFLGFIWWTRFWWLCAGTVFFSFFWNACLPLFEALTLRHLGPQVRRYGRVRLWGSVGFILSVVLIGRALGAQLSIACLPQLICTLLAAIWFSSLVTPPVRAARVRASGRFWPALGRAEVIAFFVVIMLLQTAHAPYYVFFSIHLESLGLPKARIGELWALGVVSEIVLFLFTDRMFARASARTILLLSLLLSALRWWLIGSADGDGAQLVGAQVLHAASFGCTHAVGIHLTHRYFSDGHHSKGQGLYSSASFGLGGALGSLYGGHLWGTHGPPAVFGIAAGLCLMAWCIAWIWVDREPRRHALPVG